MRTLRSRHEQVASALINKKNNNHNHELTRYTQNWLTMLEAVYEYLHIDKL